MSDTETHCDAGYCQLAETADYVKKLEAQLLGCEAQLRKTVGALRKLVKLNDDYSPFGGEILRDRIERTWEEASRVLDEIEKGN